MLDQPGKINSDGSKQTADFIVNLASDMQAFLLFCILDVRGKFLELLPGAPDLEFAQLGFQ